jgi:hypothetical protein
MCPCWSYSEVTSTAVYDESAFVADQEAIPVSYDCLADSKRQKILGTYEPRARES